VAKDRIRVSFLGLILFCVGIGLAFATHEILGRVILLVTVDDTNPM